MPRFIKLFILEMFIIQSVYAQNLVPNYAFDCMSGCPTNSGQVDFVLLNAWFNPNQASPDFFNCSDPDYGTPNHHKGFQLPKQGNGYTGILATGSMLGSCGLNYREYISIELINSLTAGQCYDVSFYVNLSDVNNTAVDRIGLYFSNGAINQANTCFIPVISQIESSIGVFLTDKDNWMLISGTYNAVGGEDYINIGNFRDNASTNTLNVGGLYAQAYYFIDDVCVKPYGSVCKPTFTVSICQGDSILLGGSYQQLAGIYNDTLNTINGCDSIIETTIDLLNKPNAIVSSDTTICENSTVMLQADGGDTYIWLPGASLNDSTIPNPIASPILSTQYSVLATSNCGTDSASTTITVQNCDIYIIYIPNAFSPNGDGQNDVLRVLGKGIKRLSLKIYNRWGENVYEMDDVNEAMSIRWDGAFRGKPLNPGVFVCFLEASLINGKKITKKGSISLVR